MSKELKHECTECGCKQTYSEMLYADNGFDYTYSCKECGDVMESNGDIYYGFRNNDKVVCINNYSSYKRNRFEDMKRHVKLTVGKVYEIRDASLDLWLVNDDGNYSSYKRNRFVTLKEYRKRKLKNIL